MLGAEGVKEFAKGHGADLVGIGSMDRFDGAPMQNDPRHIFPEASSIIGLGFRIHRGLFRGIEEGTYFAGYPSMGYASINDVYAPIVLREVGNLLEDNGYEAILYQNTSVRLGCGVGKEVASDKPKPDVFLHFRIAAAICGMGEIGYSKLLLTPEFGPRQRLAFIITDAPLEPDPIFEGKICDRCMMCVKECTGQCISKTETVKVVVAGRQLEWGKIDYSVCSRYFCGACKDYNPFITSPEDEKGFAQEVGKAQQYKVGSQYWYGRALEGARGCIRACMIHLEEQGKLKNVFKEPFRRRKPWRLSE